MSETPTSTSSEPDAAAGAPPRRLERHPTDKIVAGVAGGLGHYFGVDPIVFRLAFAAFALFGGGGVLLYVIAWIAMPQGSASAGDGAAPARRDVDTAAWLGLALVVVALLMFGGMLFTMRPGFVVALMLLAGGVLLFSHSGQPREQGPRASASPPPPPPPPPAPAQPDAQAPDEETQPLGAAATEPPAWTPAVEDLEEAGEVPAPIRLGRLTLALALLGLGVLGFLDATAVLSPSMGDYVALLLAAVGGGLVVGAWWGRARGLIPIGLLLVPLALFASLLPDGAGLGGGTGERYERPLSAERLAPSYELAAGQLMIDLSDVRLPRGELRVMEATIGMGQLVVVVPPSLNVVAYADAGVGSLELFSLRTSGLRPELSAEQAPNPLEGTVELRLRAGLGEVRLERTTQVFPMRPMMPFDGRMFAPEVF